MDDALRPIRFPVELEEALEHIRLLAHRRHGYLVDRRSTRRATRKAAITPDMVWNVVRAAFACGLSRGPTAGSPLPAPRGVDFLPDDRRQGHVPEDRLPARAGRSGVSARDLVISPTPFPAAAR